MKKFILLFVRLHQPDLKTQRQRGGQWMSALPEGTVLDGFAFEAVGKLVGKHAILDDTAEGRDFGGAMILQALSFEEALRIAQGSPHVAMGGEILVKPFDLM